MKKSNFNTECRKIYENITTTSAGVGAVSDTVNSGDFYAPGDTRVPKILGSKKKPLIIKRTPIKEL